MLMDTNVEQVLCGAATAALSSVAPNEISSSSTKD